MGDALRDSRDRADSGPSDESTGERAARRLLFGSSPDLLIGVGLVVVSFVLRFSAVPRSGLFHDDAWVAVSAEHSPLLDLPAMSLSHPGFSATLRLLSTLFGGAVFHHALLPFVAGVLGPVAAFATLRHVGFHRVTSLAAGVIAAFSITLRTFSGRVKPYTVEFLAVLFAVWVVDPLSRREWSRRVGVLWVAAAVLAGSFSGGVLLVTAVMGVIFVVTARGDRAVRFPSVLLQAAMQGLWVLRIQDSYDSARLTRIWDERLDLFIDLSLNPVAVLADVAEHVRRSLEGLTNGSDLVLWLLSALLAAGTVLLARRRTMGWLAAGLVAIAIVGATVDQIPFGGQGLHTQRLVIWLFPSFLLAFSEAVDTLRRRNDLLATALAVAIAGVAVVGGLETTRYPASGVTDAVAFVEATRTDDTQILAVGTNLYPYAESSDGGVSLIKDPTQLLGFSFRFDDPDLVPRAEEGASRVLYFLVQPIRASAVQDATDALTGRGFCPPSWHEFDTSIVLVFEKRGSSC